MSSDVFNGRSNVVLSAIALTSALASDLARNFTKKGDEERRVTHLQCSFGVDFSALLTIEGSVFSGIVEFFDVLLPERVKTIPLTLNCVCSKDTKLRRS